MTIKPLSCKCGFATLLDPHGGRPASAGLGALSRRQWLACAGILALPAGVQAAGEEPGAARKRALAVKSTCLDITRAGERLVAVGERGHVLLSDDQGAQWRQAAVVPSRVTLTAVHAVDARTLWAVGHGGTLLRSADAGEHWLRVASPAQAADVLLSVRVETDGAGLAVGGFGLALRTRDGGATWARQPLVPGESGERHLNRIFVASASKWLIAAESGHVLLSDDRGAQWQAVKTPYAGSLWSGLALADGALLACGMRGNVVRSSDGGRNWAHHAVAGAGSFTGAAQRADGLLALVGVDGTLVTSGDGGATLKRLVQEDRTTLTGAVFLASGALAVASAAGPRVITALA
jgi:photosystem II stability/assembly factor-like uncharacterized protein